MQRLPSLVRRWLGAEILPESQCVNAPGGSIYEKLLLIGINPSRCAFFIYINCVIHLGILKLLPFDLQTFLPYRLKLEIEVSLSFEKVY